MSKLNDKEYECDACHGIFQFIRDERWDDNKAEKEYNQLFPNESMENRELVCDDCWEKVKPIGIK